MKLPEFRYHPYALETGVITASSDKCECCNETRGYIYSGSFYSSSSAESFCPWCIASGEAANKFSGQFSDADPLVEADIQEQIVKEVCERTPSYPSYQQERWRSHCADACAYHGTATHDDLVNASNETIDDWKSSNGLSDEIWQEEVSTFPNNHGVFDKFTCLHCKAVLLNFDMT